MNGNFTNHKSGSENGNYLHGMSESRIYRIWKSMRTRCYNKNNNRYFQYGGRGIKIEWKTFIEFMDDMYNSYEKHVKKYGEKETQIDRTNVDDNYCTENCKWVTLKIQGRNRRNNVKLTYKGVTKPISYWAEKMNMPYKVFQKRKSLLKWDDKSIIETPLLNNTTRKKRLYAKS